MDCYRLCRRRKHDTIITMNGTRDSRNSDSYDWTQDIQLHGLLYKKPINHQSNKWTKRSDICFVLFVCCVYVERTLMKLTFFSLSRIPICHLLGILNRYHVIFKSRKEGVKNEQWSMENPYLKNTVDLLYTACKYSCILINVCISVWWMDSTLGWWSLKSFVGNLNMFTDVNYKMDLTLGRKNTFL
jgi:hypothetical protein